MSIGDPHATNDTDGVIMKPEKKIRPYNSNGGKKSAKSHASASQRRIRRSEKRSAKATATTRERS